MPVQDQEVAAIECQVAELHRRAQALNKAGVEAEATAVYKQLAALDDQALELRMAAAAPPTAADVAAATAALPAFYALLPPPPACSEQQRQRAIGAVMGAMAGDAAACSLQWVYCQSTMAALAAERPQLEFFDPPQCPFFEYPLGSPSPYFEQAAVLLRSLVQVGSLDCAHYAAAMFEAFGPGYSGYRDRSTKSFLRRYAAGALPPLTGGEDDQANAFARLPPLVALYTGAGREQLLVAVERMIRVTQNDVVAVAYGCAAALVLDSTMQGSSVTAAVASTVTWLQQQAAQGRGQQSQPGQDARQHEQQSGLEAAAPAVPAALWREVADRLLQAAELAPLLPLEAATALGRNCHLPNSLQTPLQVVLHLEHRQAQVQVHTSDEGRHAARRGPAAQQAVQALLSGSPDAGPTEAAGSLAAAAAKEAVGAAASGAAQAAGKATADACLPCSTGACELRFAPEQAAAAGHEVLARVVQWQQHGGMAAALPPDTFAEAVRLAIRPGGCCASRAGYVGALLGAAGVQPPASWVQRVLGYTEVAQQAQRLAHLRD